MNNVEGKTNYPVERKYRDADMERMVCQMKALIRQAWPEEFNVKRADLKVVRPDGKLVWPKKQRRRNLARVKAARAKNDAAKKCGSPRSMKDVATPTLATVFHFPGALIGDDLHEQWQWVSDNSRKWETTDTYGRKPLNKNVFAMLQGMTVADGEPPITEHTMRKEVQEGRTRIEARNRIKAYLERRGADLGEIRNAEEALFALFDFVEVNP